MMEHDGGRNGYPSWDRLIEKFGAIERCLGGLQTGQQLTIEQVRLGFDRVHQRIDNLHLHGSRELDRLRDRVTTIEAGQQSSTWRDRFGISAKELVGLIVVVAMSVTGTLSSDIVVAWLGH